MAVFDIRHVLKLLTASRDGKYETCVMSRDELLEDGT